MIISRFLTKFDELNGIVAFKVIYVQIIAKSAAFMKKATL